MFSPLGGLGRTLRSVYESRSVGTVACRKASIGFGRFDVNNVVELLSSGKV